MVKRRGCVEHKMYYIINDIKGMKLGISAMFKYSGTKTEN